MFVDSVTLQVWFTVERLIFIVYLQCNVASLVDTREIYCIYKVILEVWLIIDKLMCIVYLQCNVGSLFHSREANVYFKFAARCSCWK